MSKQNTLEIVNGLYLALEDTLALCLKAQKFYWRATGLRFHQLHSNFEEHYHEMHQAVSLLSERIDSLSSNSGLSIDNNERRLSKNALSSNSINDLFVGHVEAQNRASSMVKLANRCRDEDSAKLMKSRRNYHQKIAWQLKALI